jgi:hypothetical protein
MLRAAFKLALRQAEGLMMSVVELLGCELAVPDHTTLSRRAIKPPCIARPALPEGPLHVVIDSTGLNVYGAGEWLADKHGQRARRQYRKLHLAVDADSGQIVAVTLTGQDVDDASQVGPLLEQIPAEVDQITADGAYDGEPTYAIIAARELDAAARAGDGRFAPRRPRAHRGGARQTRLAGGDRLRAARAGRDHDGALQGTHRSPAARAQ